MSLDCGASVLHTGASGVYHTTLVTLGWSDGQGDEVFT
jgi:hypothetical protein